MNTENNIEKSLEKLIIENLESEQTQNIYFSWVIVSIVVLGSSGLIIFYLAYIKKMDRFLSAISYLPYQSLSIMHQNIIRLNKMIDVTFCYI